MKTTEELLRVLQAATASDEMARDGCCAGYLRLCKLARAVFKSFDLTPTEIALAVEQYRETRNYAPRRDPTNEVRI